MLGTCFLFDFFKICYLIFFKTCFHLSIKVFWKEPSQNNHKEIVLDQHIGHHDDIRLKPSRKSRREHFEIESKDYKHKPFLENESSELNPKKRHIDNKTSQDKHVSKEIDVKLRESLPHHYTREEKEWLKVEFS